MLTIVLLVAIGCIYCVLAIVLGRNYRFSKKKEKEKKKENTYKTQLQKNPMYGDLAVFLNAAQRWSIAVF